MKGYTIYDSEFEYSYDDYEDFCYGNGIEPKGFDSEDYQEYLSAQKQIDYDYFMAALSHSPYNGRKWIIEGSLGLWCGSRTIVPCVVDSLEEGILKCFGQCDIFEVKKDNSKVMVRAVHHDGTNVFTLQCLSEKGSDRYQRHGKVSLKNKENLETLPENIFG